MKLSIIIPMYNVENYISQCLDSLLDQKTPKTDYEIIIIDDESTDNSLLKAKEFSSLHDNIKVISQKNKGVSVTRNNGIMMATGKYIWFIDSDDYIASNTMHRLIEFVNLNNLEMVEFNMVRTKARDLYVSNNKNLSNFDAKILSGPKYVSVKNFNDSACLYLYKRDFLIKSKITFTDGKTMEDMVFNAELILKTKRIAYYPIDVYRYVINPNSIWTNNDPQTYRKSIHDFIFMTIKYSDIIQLFENKKIDITILKIKQQNMLYNIVKRLLKSNFKFSEISQILKNLSSHHLYPLRPYKEKETSRKLLTSIFNKKILFFIVILSYRIFRLPIEKFIIKNYQNKREKQLKRAMLNL